MKRQLPAAASQPPDIYNIANLTISDAAVKPHEENMTLTWFHCCEKKSTKPGSFTAINVKDRGN